MARTVSVDRVDAVLDELSYPLMRTDAAIELKDVRLDLGDREVNLGAAISETGSDSFGSVEDLRSDLLETLPGDDPPASGARSQR